MYCFNLANPFRWNPKPATRQLFCLSQEKVAAFADLFFFLHFWFTSSSCFYLLARFYHTALLARLFMRKVAQSTCKIKIIISSCWATAIICAPCAVHITQPEYSEGGMGREREGELEKMQMQWNFVRLLCVCVSVCCGIVVNAACCPIVVTQLN